MTKNKLVLTEYEFYNMFNDGTTLRIIKTGITGATIIAQAIRFAFENGFTYESVEKEQIIEMIKELDIIAD